VRAGSALYRASSMSAWQFAKALYLQELHDGPDSSMQNHYNLIYRERT